MKTFTILAALSAIAIAVPLRGKRDVAYTTVVEEVWATEYTTTTVWVDATDAPGPEDAFGAFYEQPSVPQTTSSAAPAYTAPPLAKPQNAAPVSSPAAAPYVQPAQAAPAQPSPSPAYVAPAAAAAAAPSQPAYQAPAPVSQPTYQPPAAAPSAAPSSGGGSYGGGKGDHTGDITYYDVEVGLGSCGTSATNSENVVALSKLDMNNGINPNANPLCGTLINIYSDTGVHQARVFDTCPVCASGALDMPEPLFKAVAPNGDGRVHGITWSFASLA